MIRKCPSCGSANVRRSSFHGASAQAWLGVFSPYRCRDCEHFFRVVSRKFYICIALVAVSVGGVGALVLIYAAVIYGTPFATALIR